MLFDNEMGIAYDTIFYGVLFFNFERTKTHFEKTYGILDDDFKYFEELKKTIPPPSPELYPFFYCDWSTPSFMTSHFYSSFQFGSESFPEYLQRINDNSNDFKTTLISHYSIKSVDATNNEQIASELLTQTINDNTLIVSLLRLLFQYKTIVDSFFSFMQTTYGYIKQLHDDHAIEIQELVKKYSSKKFIDKLGQIDFITSSPTLVNDKISICFLNCKIVINKGNPDTGNYYILGKRCEDTVDHHFNYYKIEPRLLCEALGHPIKFSILQKLKEKEFTATQLSDIIFASRQAINAHLLWMLEYMFIQIVKRNKSEVYYRVNPDFFRAAKNILFKFTDEFTKYERIE